MLYAGFNYIGYQYANNQVRESIIYKNGAIISMHQGSNGFYPSVVFKDTKGNRQVHVATEYEVTLDHNFNADFENWGIWEDNDPKYDDLVYGFSSSSAFGPTFPNRKDCISAGCWQRTKAQIIFHPDAPSSSARLFDKNFKYLYSLSDAIVEIIIFVVLLFFSSIFVGAALFYINSKNKENRRIRSTR